MIYLYTNEPDDTCHKIAGTYGRPVNMCEVNNLQAKGWTIKPVVLTDKPKKEDKPTNAEVALSLGINPFDADGNKIHHHTLARLIKEAQGNDEG